MTGTAQLTSNRKCYPLSKAEIEINVMKEMCVALNMRTCLEKTTFRQKRLKHNGGGRVIMGLGATLPNHIPACRSEFLFIQITAQKLQPPNGPLSSKVVCHHRSYSIKGRPPSSIKGHLPSKVIFHQMMSSIKCLVLSKVVSIVVDDQAD